MQGPVCFKLGSASASGHFPLLEDEKTCHHVTFRGVVVHELELLRVLGKREWHLWGLQGLDCWFC